MDERYAELLGIMSGDGCLSNTGKSNLVYICGHIKDDFEYHNNITKNLFKEIFNKEVNLYKRYKQNVVIIRFSDKVIFNELSKNLPIGIKYDKLKTPKTIVNNSKFLFSFVRGLVDTDGTIIFSKQHRKKHYYPRIEISSKSKTFLQDILFYLKKEGFYGSVSHKVKNIYLLDVPGFKNLNFWF